LAIDVSLIAQNHLRMDRDGEAPAATLDALILRACSTRVYVNNADLSSPFLEPFQSARVPVTRFAIIRPVLHGNAIAASMFPC
jgi:hypothetical protein